MIKRTRKLNMEFDCKRSLVNPVMNQIEHQGQVIEHIFFRTEPFSTVSEFMTYRSHFDGWRKGRCVIDIETNKKSFFDAHCLKNLADWDNWQDYHACMTYFSTLKELKLGRKFKLNGVKSTDALLLRLFIRAYVHKEWGLAGSTLSFNAVAIMLTATGYPATVDDFKIVGRSKVAYVPFPVLPLTEVVAKLLRVLVKQFSQLDLACVLSTEDVVRFTQTLN